MIIRQYERLKKSSKKQEVADKTGKRTSRSLFTKSTVM